MESSDVNSKGYYVASKMQYTPYGVCPYGYSSTNKHLNAYARSSTLQFYSLLQLTQTKKQGNTLKWAPGLCVGLNR